MTQDAPWPAAMTQATGRQVRRFRTDPWRSNRMTADDVAKAMTDKLGVPYTRSQVATLEAGRRTSIPLGEIHALAAVLEVPPILLAFPLGVDEVIEYLPGKSASVWSAVQWFS